MTCLHVTIRVRVYAVLRVHLASSPPFTNETLTQPPSSNSRDFDSCTLIDFHDPPSILSLFTSIAFRYNQRPLLALHFVVSNASKAMDIWKGSVDVPFVGGETRTLKGMSTERCILSFIKYFGSMNGTRANTSKTCVCPQI